MPSTTQVQAAIEHCVAAGVAVRRADLEAAVLRAVAAEHRSLTKEDAERLAQLEADATRLSKAFEAAQGRLYLALPALFQQNFAEVNRRIKERLAM